MSTRRAFLILATLTLATLAAVSAFAQTPPVLPAFEAASVRVNNSSTNDSSSRTSTGQVIFTNQTLSRIIERAFDLLPVQISGPPWLDSTRFDITAKFPGGTNPTDRTAMLRNLLEERFLLKTHWETKTMSGYSLTVAKGGFKLKPVDPADGPDMNSTGSAVRTLTARRMPLALLAGFLSRSLGELVVDNTGLAGAFDVELRWTADDLASTGDASDPVPSLFTALQETAGLRLARERVPVQILVIDSVQRVPTEN